MINLEDPIQFIEEKTVGDVLISYTNLMEISQGGPVVGNLAINGRRIKGRFGGPSLVDGNFLYLPSQVKRFLGTCFKLAQIDISTLEIQKLGRNEHIIFLDKKDGNKIYYFNDMQKSNHQFLQVLE